MILFVCVCVFYSISGILIYTDGGQGASEACVAIARSGLVRAVSWLTQKEFLKRGLFEVEKTDAAAIREGALNECCQLLVMPGGRDLPYCWRLNGEGNDKIREFVRNGGSYLGLCAGGYYGASYVRFAEGDPAAVMEVVGPRELKFYPGVAWGPTYPGFHYNSNVGARACSLNLKPSIRRLLTGVCSEDIATVKVYYDGGGYFQMFSGDVTQYVDGATDVRVLATYDMSDYSVSQWDTPCGHDDVPRPVQLPDNPAAIVSSQYGAGKVVLSGVHLEASPASLTEQYAQDPHIEKVADELTASETTRQTVFHTIIGHLLARQ